MFRAKRILAGRRVLITGASSGIGRSLASQFAKLETKLLLTARRQDRLESAAAEARLAGSEVHFVVGDITDESVRRELLSVAGREWGGLDILINNAGIGGVGAFAAADEERLRLIMEVNFFAPAELTRKALPVLRASDDGVVVNIGSVLGHCAVPKKSEYCASKFALHGLTDSLRMELASHGVDVLLVSPSTTSSEFFLQAIRSDENAATHQRSMTPDAVANQVVRAIENRRREVILSAGGKLLVWADRLIPGITSRVLRRFG